MGGTAPDVAPTTVSAHRPITRSGPTALDGRFELGDQPVGVRFLRFVGAPLAILEAGGHAGDVDQERRELAAAPFVAADRQRAERVAVIALTTADEDAALSFTALDEVLARQLERGLHRLRAARHQVDVVEPLRRVLGEAVGQRLGHVGGEEAGVRVRDRVDLGVHRRQHVGVRVPETRHRGAAARVDVALSLSIDQLDALAGDCDRRRGAKAAMHHMAHVGILIRAAVAVPVGIGLAQQLLSLAQSPHDRLSAAHRHFRHHPLDQRMRRNERMEEGARRGLEEQALVGVARKRRELRIGERDHGQVAGAGAPHAFDRLARIGREADGNQHRLRGKAGDGLGQQAVRVVHEDAVSAQHRVQVVRVQRDAVAASKAEKRGGRRLEQAARDALEDGGLVQACQRRDVFLLQALETVERAAAGASPLHAARARGEIGRAPAKMRAEIVLEGAVGVEPDGARQPRQRRRHDVRPARLLAHRQHADLRRMGVHPARRALQLLRQPVELRLNARERGCSHESSRSLPQRRGR